MAWAASRTKDTYLAAQFHRIRARKGAKRKAIAVAHSIIKIVYHLISKPEERYCEYGGDYFLNKNKDQEQRHALKTLQSLGFTVELTAREA